MKITCSALFLLLASTGLTVAQQTTAAAPKVVETMPKPWQIDAPASQDRIAITFDQRMSPAYTAWLGRSSVVGEVDLDSMMSPDRKTFSLKANLQPGRIYVFALNEKNIPGVGFQNDQGLSAPPFFLVFQTTGAPPPELAAPRAVSTLPAHDTQAIDPARLKSLTVVFDRPMASKKHGLIMTENKKPVDLSKAPFQYSTDGKTFTLAYDFKPSSVYEFELNNTQNIGFASAQRIPLWPVRLTFSTGQPQ